MHLDLTSMTRLFLVSRRPEFHTLVYTRYRPDFGANHIYALELKPTDETTEWRRVVKDLQVPRLFGGLTWSKLASKLAQNQEIRWSNLTEAFDLEALRAENPGDLLFAVNPNGRLSVFSGETNPPVGPGWKIAVLAEARTQRAKAAARSEESETRLPG
jgi:hypothetical protein